MDCKKLTEKEIYQNVDWCFKRAGNLSEEDAEALYSEFNEWIEFSEDDSIRFIDVKKIKNLPK